MVVFELKEHHVRNNTEPYFAMGNWANLKPAEAALREDCCLRDL